MPKILLIDDEKIIRDRLGRLMEMDGYTMFYGEDGPSGLAAFEKEHPDIVCLDIKMPGMDGIEVLKKIKEAKTKTEVIMMTGHGGTETAILALRLGAFDYLEKPVDYDAVEISIKRGLERQQMQETLDANAAILLESSRKWQQTFDAIGDSVCILSSDGKINKINKTTKELFPNQEVLGCTCYKLFHGTDTRPDFCPVASVLKTGVPAATEICEAHLGGKWLAISAYPIMDEKNCIQEVVHVARDITTRKAMDKEKEALTGQLIQAGKLASLGTLSAGVAHELNNPLTAVMGFAHVLEINASDQEKVKAHGAKIANAAMRMKKIINHLREFSRESQINDWKELSVTEPIENSMILLGQQLKNRNINLITEFSPDVPKIWGDTNKLESVFQNLISNSRDALGDVTDTRQKFIKIQVVKVDGGLKVIHQDNAMGMTNEVREKIFNPFFTTKPVGKGTGLGLSLVIGIVEQHKGTITCESKVGEGTTFEVFFPEDRRKAPRDVAVAADPTAQRQTTSKPSLLVIDIEQDICDLVRDFVGGEFAIKAFIDPKDGLKEVEATKYDLILSNYKMPGVSGADILFCAKKAQPNTPVVLMTDLSPEDKDLKNILANGAKGPIAKPFEDAASLVKRLKAFL